MMCPSSSSFLRLSRLRHVHAYLARGENAPPASNGETHSLQGFVCGQVGEYTNIKLTTPEDMPMATSILCASRTSAPSSTEHLGNWSPACLLKRSECCALFF